MTSKEIIRSWKDEDYLGSLREADRKLLPDNPAGLFELSDDELVAVDGGTAFVGPSYHTACTFDFFCNSFNFENCSFCMCPTWFGRICWLS